MGYQYELTTPSWRVSLTYLLEIEQKCTLEIFSHEGDFTVRSRMDFVSWDQFLPSDKYFNSSLRSYFCKNHKIKVPLRKLLKYLPKFPFCIAGSTFQGPSFNLRFYWDKARLEFSWQSILTSRWMIRSIWLPDNPPIKIGRNLWVTKINVFVKMTLQKHGSLVIKSFKTICASQLPQKQLLLKRLEN